jgi:hypothetical protein
MYSEHLSLKGNWNFCVTQGKPLTREEWNAIKNGGSIDRTCDVQNIQNIITLPFRTALTALLSRPIADDPVPFRLTHQELGTGTEAASELNSDLETPDESTFTLLGDVVAVSKEIQVTGFYSEGEATGHWREYGIWLNGDDEEGKVLFNRININREVGGASSLSIFGTVNFNI